MKLQIKSHSIRFRITADEMTDLSNLGRLDCETKIPQANGECATLRYGVRVVPEGNESEIGLSPFGMELNLTDADFAELKNPGNEGAYIRKEYAGEDGKMIRFVAYIEKDKKSEKDKKHKSHKSREDFAGSSNEQTLSKHPEVNEP